MVEGVEVELEEPAQGVLVHGVDLGDAHRGEEEDRAVDGDRTVA